MILLIFILTMFPTVYCYQNGEQEDWSTRFAARTYYDPHPSPPCTMPDQCVPLSSCPILTNILNNACVLTERVGALGCGYPGSGLICCPKNFMALGSNRGPTWYYPGASLGNPIRDLASMSSAVNPSMVYKKVGTEEVRCGTSIVQGDGYRGLGAHPWVVRVGFKNSITKDTKYPCAGSILNHRTVLTAAHCALAKADNYKLLSVRAGEWRTDSTLDCGDSFCGLPHQDIAISHVVVHPGYEQRTFKNDIALIILRTDINFTLTTQPICLVDAWSETANNALLIGWGKTAGQRVSSVYQQILDLPVVPQQHCSSIYGRSIPITEDHLCAGGEVGKDACDGFGGAPLIVKHSNANYQIGIMSFGSNQCGAAGIPSVYSNIKKFSSWIKENTPVMFA